MLHSVRKIRVDQYYITQRGVPRQAPVLILESRFEEAKMPHRRQILSKFACGEGFGSWQHVRHWFAWLNPSPITNPRWVQKRVSGERGWAGGETPSKGILWSLPRVKRDNPRPSCAICSSNCSKCVHGVHRELRFRSCVILVLPSSCCFCGLAVLAEYAG